MIRFFDMFSGIGGFRAGLERAGGFECVGHCEIDKHADAAYRAVHNVKESETYYTDARTIDTNTLPEFDLLCAGFPCQSFSIAGKRKGFSDPRGTMFFEIARVARAKRPSYLLLENVPGLLSHDKGRTYSTILRMLCNLGYSCEWQVLNSKNFGVPQSRRRVYIIGYLDRRCAGKILPVRETNAKTLIQLLGGRQDSRVYDPKGLSKTLLAKAGGPGGKTGLYAVGYNRRDKITGIIDTAYALNASNFRGLNRNQTQNAVINSAPMEPIRIGNVNPSGKGQNGNVYSDEGICPTLTANKGEGIKISPMYTDKISTVRAVLAPDREKVRQNGRRIKDDGEPMFTLTSQDRHGVLLIKEATRRGYSEAVPGDSIDLSFADANTRRGRVGSGVAHTLDTGCSQGVMTPHARIRRLVPRECLRLQGFSDDQIDRLLSVSSDAQAYKQAGNAVTVNVVYELGLRLKAAHAASVAAARANKEEAI
ncbi:MAG: DNA (cytosine-5-)-methyltransferase [Sporolactobacillus sp.]